MHLSHAHRCTLRAIAALEAEGKGPVRGAIRHLSGYSTATVGQCLTEMLAAGLVCNRRNWRLTEAGRAVRP